MAGSRRCRARATLLVCVILGIGVGTVAQDPCYENVTVRSAGLDEANGRLTYWRTLGSGYPQFWNGYPAEGPYVWLGYNTNEDQWDLAVTIKISDEEYEHYRYTNSANTSTPPTSGWQRGPGEGVYLPAPSPAPRVSGGAPCGGAGDEAPPNIEISLSHELELEEGEDPPMVGSLPLSAEPCLGEEVGLDLLVVDAEGDPIPDAQASVVLYTVTISEDGEEREVVLKAAERPDRRTGICHISLTLEGLAPGIYDLRVRVDPRILDPVYLRIRVIDCADGGQHQAPPPCYRNIIVTGAGEDEANGTYRFAGFDDASRPVWESRRDWTGVGGHRRASGAQYGVARIHFRDQAWELVLDVSVGSSSTVLYLYLNESTTETPPASGWERHPTSILWVFSPPPTLSGGEPCPTITEEPGPEGGAHPGLTD